MHCAFFFIVSLASQAQEYSTGIGARWGKFNSGITMKHFFNADNATGAQLDLYRTFVYSGGYTAKLFFIKQKSFRVPILQIPLDYIYGFGLHAGYFPYVFDPVGRLSYGYRSNGKVYPYHADVITIGLDATLQIEYQIPMHDLPVTISIDANPFFEFLNRGPEYVDFGVNARYVFK
jgi:hypothetical protein